MRAKNLYNDRSKPIVSEFNQISDELFIEDDHGTQKYVYMRVDRENNDNDIGFLYSAWDSNHYFILCSTCNFNEEKIEEVVRELNAKIERNSLNVWSQAEEMVKAHWSYDDTNN